MEMDRTDEQLLETIADLHGVPEGSFNIPKNGQLLGRHSDTDIEIVSKTDKDGIDHLADTCAVAGLGPRNERDGSVGYYLSEPVVDDDVKAVGVLMMVTALLMKEERQR